MHRLCRRLICLLGVIACLDFTVSSSPTPNIIYHHRQVTDESLTRRWDIPSDFTLPKLVRQAQSDDMEEGERVYTSGDQSITFFLDESFRAEVYPCEFVSAKGNDPKIAVCKFSNDSTEIRGALIQETLESMTTHIIPVLAKYQTTAEKNDKQTKYVLVLEMGQEFNFQELLTGTDGCVARPDTEQGLLLFKQVLDAVEFLHTNEKEPVAFCDLRPDNFIPKRYNDDDLKITLQLTDFSTALSNPATELAATDCPGTVGYKPPESYHDQKLDPKSVDVWALGMILIDALGEFSRSDEIATGLLSALPQVDTDSTPQTTKDWGDVAQFLEKADLGDAFSADIISLLSKVLCVQRYRLDITEFRSQFENLDEYKAALKIPDASDWEG